MHSRFREDDPGFAIDHGRQCAKSICDSVDDIEVIMQLVLEDIEGASMGSDKAKTFVQSSGISPSQYKGAVKKSRPEVDGPNGVKTYLDNNTLKYFPNREQMVNFRLAALDCIMQHYCLGKYARQPSKDLSLMDVVKKVHQNELIFDCINGDLGAAADLIGKSTSRVLMAYAYARRVAVSGLYLQGHFDKHAFDYVKSIFTTIQMQTDGSKEFQDIAFYDAIEYMQTYHPMINVLFARQLYSAASICKTSPRFVNDQELFRVVLETLHLSDLAVRK